MKYRPVILVAYIPLSLAVVTVFTGCFSLKFSLDIGDSGGGGGSSTRTAVPSQLVISDNPVPDAIGRMAVLDNLNGTAVIQIHDAASKFRLGVNAEITGCRQEEFLYIKADKFAGAIQAFELFMIQDDVILYVPKDKVVYTGVVADCDRLGVPIKPDEILKQLLNSDIELQTRQWRATGGADQNGLVVYECEDHQSYVTVDHRTGFISRIEHRAPDGTVNFRKTLENYRTINMATGQIDKASAGSTNVYPFTLKMEWPIEQRRLEFHFKRLNPNYSFQESDKDFTIPPNVNKLPIDRARIDSD